jgi:hypothetical protein
MMRRIRMRLPDTRPRPGVVALLLAVACALGGCLTTSSNPDPMAATTGRVAAAPPKPTALADMAGRWRLASPGGASCSMTFSGSAGAVEGTIAPEGGCPGNFFTSRRWAFDQSALIIRNHNGDPLARLALSATGSFEGQASGGELVSLAR